MVGVGSMIPERTQPWRFRKKFNVKRPFAIYIGRIDENKGCPDLQALHQLRGQVPAGLDLVLLGKAVFQSQRIPGSGTWGSSPTKTSSTLWPQRTCSSCRRHSKACR